jgi:hypothetical protein
MTVVFCTILEPAKPPNDLGNKKEDLIVIDGNETRKLSSSNGRDTDKLADCRESRKSSYKDDQETPDHAS